MRLRVLLEPHYGATYQQILALARAAEESGFDAFFRSDHYLGIDAEDTTYQPTDSWTTLAGLAVEVATVAQMSGGRAELGIGTGWYEREHQYFGIPSPPAGERFDRLEELAAAGMDTIYFHLYAPGDTDHIRLLGAQVVSRF